MPHLSVAERTRRLDRQLLSTDRLVAARLEVLYSDGKTCITVGGTWDSVAKSFIDAAGPTRKIKLKASQDEMGRAMAEYIKARLAGDDSRAALLMAIGNRGGGKTFLCGGVFMVLIALALPGSWQIGVSITSKQNREVKEAIAMVAAAGWVTQDVTDFRDQRTVFLTGSTILWLTSKNPKALRQALLIFEHVLINEGQDQREVVFTNSISAIRSGGVVTVATNPPQETAGDWVAVLYDGITSGSKDGKAFVIQNAGNDAVNHSTLGKISRLLRMVNPDAADADGEGIIRLSGNVGYPGFTRMPRKNNYAGEWESGHIGVPPDLGWVDITRQRTAEDTNGTPFDFIAGGDFQTEPGSCAPVGKLYRTPAGNVVLWIREFITTNGTEQDLTLALTSHGYFPGPVDYDGRPAASVLIVGDATGARQNAEHRKRDPYSFARLRADGWSVLPPSYYGPKRTPWNPLVEDSRKQMKFCFQRGAILLAPACAEPGNGFPSLIESFARTKVNPAGKFEKKGHHTHGPDGVRYLAWRFLPKPTAAPPKAGLDMESFDALRNAKLGFR